MEQTITQRAPALTSANRMNTRSATEYDVNKNRPQEHNQPLSLAAASDRDERFLALMLPVKLSLSRFISGLERDADEARDVMSETIAIAYEQFDTLSSETAFLSWIMTIARRLVYRRERRERFRGFLKRSTRFFTDDDSAHNDDPFAEIPAEDNATTAPDNATDVQLLHDALETLPLKQREAIVLADVMGYALHEIAELQGDGLSAVKQRVVRGREKLRHILTER
jgi:RNA polymerase sigma-70 factor (ECF subfamily)